VGGAGATGWGPNSAENGGKRAQASWRFPCTGLLSRGPRAASGLVGSVRIGGPGEVDDAPLLLGGQAGATASLRIDGFTAILSSCFLMRQGETR